ncbi:hypothetical protein ACFQ7F_31060 [Streptomyces sp. NPDC056486]|uniref:hypothetical protein n=1 Tax=Streptomyces sp. NPDC056486 TaxID=3345835 RepID=UPI0036ABD697
MELAQIGVAEKTLIESEAIRSNPLSARAELEYMVVLLQESLGDVLRIAESRRQRLTALWEADTRETDCGPTRAPKALPPAEG